MSSPNAGINIDITEYPIGIPSIKPGIVNNKFCVANNFVKNLLLNPKVFSVTMSFFISIYDSRFRLYRITSAKITAKNTNAVIIIIEVSSNLSQ